MLIEFALLWASSIPDPGTWAAQASGPEEEQLSILFVGHDPEQPYVNYAPTEGMLALHAERTPAFEGFLSQHFDTVRVVHAADYQVAMSADVDVTIFDAKPPVLVPAKDNGRFFPSLLPEDFTGAVLTIGEVSADVANGSGLKHDWL